MYRCVYFDAICNGTHLFIFKNSASYSRTLFVFIVINVSQQCVIVTTLSISYISLHCSCLFLVTLISFTVGGGESLGESELLLFKRFYQYSSGSQKISPKRFTHRSGLKSLSKGANKQDPRLFSQPVENPNLVLLHVRFNGMSVSMLNALSCLALSFLAFETCKILIFGVPFTAIHALTYLLLYPEAGHWCNSHLIQLIPKVLMLAKRQSIQHAVSWISVEASCQQDMHRTRHAETFQMVQ